MTKFYHEKGQAMVEMCAGLVGILIVIIAIIMISGISITNIRMLQESKSNAEILALTTENIDDITINVSDIDIAGNALQSADYSEANDPDRQESDKYDFYPLSVAASKLRLGSQSTSKHLGTAMNFSEPINWSVGSSTNKELFSLRSFSSKEQEAFYKAAARWLGVKKDDMLNKWLISNKVYLPKVADEAPVNIVSPTPQN